MAASEKEKMLSGAWYNPRDPELLALYFQARKRLRQWHDLPATDLKERAEILSALLGEMGAGVWIEAPFHCDYGRFIRIGENSFLNGNCFLLDDNFIDIGKNCLLGPNVQIYTAIHPLSAADRIVPEADRETGAPVYRTRSEGVRVGDNVWLGGNSVLLPGVRIGDGTTVGAGSVVTKDIPPGVLALGNPCRVVREIGS